MTVVGFVPARGGSERIPRKNLRTVHGIPLVARTIGVLKAAGVEEVVVSTDDAEIAAVAELWGATIDSRPPALAGPDITIDQVVDDYVARHLWAPNDLIAVAQPTSPLLAPSTVANAIAYAVEHGETVFTATAERGLLWSASTVPLYDGPRRNSTTPGEAAYYRETGGLVVFAPAERGHGDNWPPFPRTLMEIGDAEAIDIDDYGDLVRARAGQRPSRIQLRYVESFQLGSGHRRRCETLAVELMGRHIVEVVDHTKAPLPQKLDVTSYGSNVESFMTEQDLVILDILDTKVEDVQRLYDNGVQYVVTLEDLGLGAALADLTINELYAEDARGPARSDRCGPRWAVLRPEFQGHPFPASARNSEFTVVVTFGGTDPTGMTEHVVETLSKLDERLAIRVVIPPARDTVGSEAVLAGVDQQVQWLKNPNMAAEFLTADLAITSSGRTVHEAAACGIPVIAVPVNEREKLHGVCPGVMYTSIEMLAEKVALAIKHWGITQTFAQHAHDAVDGNGAQRIAYLVDGLLGGML